MMIGIALVAPLERAAAVDVVMMTSTFNLINSAASAGDARRCHLPTLLEAMLSPPE
jgi:hypothetical protein